MTRHLSPHPFLECGIKCVCACVCATGSDRVAKSLACDSPQSEGIAAELKPTKIDRVLHVVMRIFLGKLALSLDSSTATGRTINRKRSQV